MKGVCVCVCVGWLWMCLFILDNGLQLDEMNQYSLIAWGQTSYHFLVQWNFCVSQLELEAPFSKFNHDCNLSAIISTQGFD